MKDSYTLRHGRGGARRRLREALRRLLPDLRPLRPRVRGGGGALRRHGRQPVARVHGEVTDAGEDWVVECPKCGYAANLEKAVAGPAPPPAADPEGDLTPEEFHTPGRKTIAEVAAFTGAARDFADQEPGDGGRRQAGARAVARRPSVERDETRRGRGRDRRSGPRTRRRS